MTNDTLGTDSLGTYIYASQIWALVLAVIGGIGNLITVLAVVHELYLNYETKQKKRHLINRLSLEEKESHESSKTKIILIKCCIYVCEFFKNVSSNQFSGQSEFYRNPSIENVSVEYSSQTSTSVLLQEPQEKPSELLTVDNYVSTSQAQSTTSRLSICSSVPELPNNLELIENGVRLTDVHRLPSSSQLRETLVPNPKCVSSHRKFYLKYDRGTIIILAICISDLLYCLVNLPLTYYTYTFYLTGKTPNKTLCITAAFIRNIVSYAEWMTVGFLFIERGINLRRLQKGKLFSPFQTWCCLVGIWIFTCLVHLPFHLLHVYGFNKRTSKCHVIFHSDIPSGYKIYVFAVVLFLPCFLVLSGFVSITVQILRNKMNLDKIGIPYIIEQRRRETRYSIIIVSGLTFLFLICIMPIATIETVAMVKDISGTSPRQPSDLRDVKINIIAYMVYWIQFAANFLVYVVANPGLRIAYVNLLKRLKCC